MSDYVSAVLDELVPRFEDGQGDWERVVADAGAAAPTARVQVARRARWLTRRRLALVAVALAAIALPLVAVAASQEWWFFRTGAAPEPVTGVSVITTGTWNGREWQLLAYRSSTDGICFGVAPPEAARTAGAGAAMACAPVEGMPATPNSKPGPRVSVTFLTSSLGEETVYAVGPVVDAAAEVEVHLAGGEVVRAATFDAPEELGAIRFYAMQLPISRARGATIEKLAGRDRDGRVVACLVVPLQEERTPLSACEEG
jgi:hypothetical protein